MKKILLILGICGLLSTNCLAEAFKDESLKLTKCADLSLSEYSTFTIQKNNNLKVIIFSGSEGRKELSLPYYLSLFPGDKVFMKNGSDPIFQSSAVRCFTLKGVKVVTQVLMDP